MKFCQHLHQLGIDRNTMMHSVWGVRPEGEGRTVRRFKRTAKPKTGFKVNPTAMSVDQVWEFVDRLVHTEAKLWEFVP